MSDYIFQPVTKNAGDTKPVSLDLFRWCANYWRANEQFSLNEYIRPLSPTGFAYQATTAGTTGARQPTWPKTLGGTVVDGSVTWTCVVASTNGLNAISSPSAVSEPTGLTISAVTVSESTKILATYSGGTVDQDYDAVFAFTLNGVPREARQKVKVRRR